MSEQRTVDFRLVSGLACLAAVFPIYRLVVNVLGGDASALAPINAWVWLIIGLAWVLITWLTRAQRPLATLVLTGFAGGVLTIVVVGIIQLTASGSADLLSSPFGVVGLLMLTTLGGTVCGLIAWGLQSLSQKSQS